MKIETLPGNEISATINQAIVLAKEANDIVSFEFNGVIVSVLGDSDPALIHRDWSRAMAGCIGKQVGPDAKVELSPEEIRRDAEIRVELARQSEERRRRWREESDRKRTVMEAKLKDSPELEITDPEGWATHQQINSDGYGGRCISFARDWGRLMQLEIARGKTVAEVADPTSHEADYDGITGFMAGAGRAILVRFWKHGQELKSAAT